MSIKRFTIFFAIWALACAFVIEPAFITPLFDAQPSINLAFNGPSNTLDMASGEAFNRNAVESMDHFRVLCLMYFGLPAVVYLATQLKDL
ncbi:MAG TPA: hypothetical protein VFV57_07565 [Limnobacter sp.]|nr:hypothetical protein [Limnobacter sp.]